MGNGVVALCNVARYALNHAIVLLPDGETKSGLKLALAAVNDAIDAYGREPMREAA